MRYWFFVFLFYCMPLQAVEVIDDSGRSIQLTKPVQRVISLAPHVTELLFAAGAGDKIVGVVKYSNFPEAAKTIPQVGGYKKLDLERIVSMKPDAIIAWQTGNRTEEMSQLEKLGLTVFYTEPRRLPDIASLLQRLGKLTGNTQQGEQAAQQFLQAYQQLKKKYQGKEVLRAFYQIWDKPLMTINNDHIISDVMRLCGLQNVFGEIENLVPRISEEAVLEADPQIIIASGMAKFKPQWAQQWKRWPQLSATRLNALLDIHPDIIQRHSPRILQGASELCEKADAIRNINIR